jgi:hypothetical protein
MGAPSLRQARHPFELRDELQSDQSLVDIAVLGRFVTLSGDDVPPSRINPDSISVPLGITHPTFRGSLSLAAKSMWGNASSRFEPAEPLTSRPAADK